MRKLKVSIFDSILRGEAPFFFVVFIFAKSLFSSSSAPPTPPHTQRAMITRAAGAWGRHAFSSQPLLIPRAAFTAAAATGKTKGSTKNEAREHKKETLALMACGKMGLAMGRNFLKAGYPLLVHDKHNAEAIAKLVAEVRSARGKKARGRGRGGCK
jgi:hypothetical protein